MIKITNMLINPNSEVRRRPGKGKIVAVCTNGNYSQKMA
jgi:hypothetical protein